MKNENHDEEFMRALKHARKKDIEAARAIIRGASSAIHEEIKWNAPSYRVGTDFFATFHLRAKGVQLVFHTGAKVKANPKLFDRSDVAGLTQEWRGNDRCVVTVDDVKALAPFVKAWIAQL